MTRDLLLWNSIFSIIGVLISFLEGFMINQVEKSIFIEKDIQINQNWAALKAHLATKGHHIDLSTTPRQFAAGFGNINYYVLNHYNV